MQVFLSWRAIYILTFDLSKKLGEKVLTPESSSSKEDVQDGTLQSTPQKTDGKEGIPQSSSQKADEEAGSSQSLPSEVWALSNDWVY